MSQGRQLIFGAFALATIVCASGCGASGALDHGQLALALKYVAYQDGDAKPVIARTEALGSLAGVNRVWAGCEIRFVLEEYDAVNPNLYGLRFKTRDLSELQDIRKSLGSADQFLLVATGPWDRSGSLGETAANAWTALPAFQGPFGAVMEEDASTFSMMVAHELGHYLGLPHVDDVADVMNPTIYSYSKNVTADQCARARATIAVYWPRALR